MADADDIACELGLEDAWGDATFIPQTRTFAFTSVGRRLRTTAGAPLSTVNATPHLLDMGANETLALSFDFTADIGDPDVDSIASATATLTDLVSGLSYPSGLSGSAVVLGFVVTQEVTALVAGRQYQMIVRATMTSDGQTYEMGLIITCPY